MMDLWELNSPRLFWQCRPDPPQELWEQAIETALPLLGLPEDVSQIHHFLGQTLGEGQFGADHWQLSSTRRLYYEIKPFLPRFVINMLKKLNSRMIREKFSCLGWPIEDRYVQFLWEVARQILLLTNNSELLFTPLWPNEKRFAFILTHDVEGEKGLKFVEPLADLEEEIGFRSSFNFVPRGYSIEAGLINNLLERGFEIGIHGLDHDGKLFKTEKHFMEQAGQINHYLKAFNAKGFRAPLMHRHPAWLQTLAIDYDLSFFDTDPYESIPGGTMSIWPFFLGHFVELPYTLVQDSTLVYVLNQDHPGIWLEKIEFLAKHHGMALLNSHPDYLREKRNFAIYKEFLQTMKTRDDYWDALPGQVADWWRSRSEVSLCPDEGSNGACCLFLQDDELTIRYVKH